MSCEAPGTFILRGRPAPLLNHHLSRLQLSGDSYPISLILKLEAMVGVEEVSREANSAVYFQK